MRQLTKTCLLQYGSFLKCLSFLLRLQKKVTTHINQFQHLSHFSVRLHTGWNRRGSGGKNLCKFLLYKIDNTGSKRPKDEPICRARTKRTGLTDKRKWGTEDLQKQRRKLHHDKSKLLLSYSHYGYLAIMIQGVQVKLFFFHNSL